MLKVVGAAAVAFLLGRNMKCGSGRECVLQCHYWRPLTLP